MQKPGMTFERRILSYEASKAGSCSDKLYAVIRSHFKPRPLE